jgi:RNA polymerase sigma factor (sigma-70 family)
VADSTQSMSKDEERFEQLFRAHVAAVRRYALRRDPCGAEDLVAEVFLVAWRRLGDVPADGALPWLLAVARRAHANALRAGRRRVALTERAGQELRAAGDAVPDPVLHDALQCLPERDREVLILIAWEGLDHAAVARVMGCTTTNVAVRAHRARRRLARELERLQAEVEPCLTTS